MGTYDILLRKNSAGALQRTIQISLKHKYVFFAVPKCAHTTVKAYLQQHEFKDAPEKFRFDQQQVHNRVASPLIAPYQLPDDLLEDVLTSNKYFRFAVVRHPVTRILSCYLDRIRRARSTARRVVGEWLGVDKDQEIAFPDFINAVNGHTDRELEEHFKLQVDLLGYPQIEMTSLVYFERLGDEIKPIFERLGIEVSDELANLSPSNNNTARLLAEYYDESLLDMVQERYRKDLQAYGYEKMVLPAAAA